MKNEKNYMGFCIPKVWQILKRFAGAFVEHKPLNSEECVNKEIKVKVGFSIYLFIYRYFQCWTFMS